MPSKKQPGQARASDTLAPANLPYQMFLLVQQMTRRFQAVLDTFGLTPLHWGILCCLWREDQLRTKEIATQLEQLGGTITVGLDVMQRKGLIERRPDEADRRVSRIFLTAKGQSLQKVLQPQAKALIDTIFEGLDHEEYLRFAWQIAELRRHNSPSTGSSGRMARAKKL